MNPQTVAILDKSQSPSLVDTKGNPLKAAGSFGNTSFSAAGFGKELGSWNPALTSADAELYGERDTIVARTRDLIRNHGIMSGAVQTHLDSVIGPGLRLCYKPDFRVLGLDPELVHEWARGVESQFMLWWLDRLNAYSDASRRLNGPQRLAQGYRSFLVTGEILESAEWVRRPGNPYRTCFKMIDPDRLSNPNYQMDTDRLTQGVELDFYAAPIAYHIRNRHPGDFSRLHAGGEKWKRVERETRFGRQNILHLFDQERPDQTRGRGGFTSSIADMKMLQKFRGVTLQAAIINAMYAAVIESGLDAASVASAMGAESTDPLHDYMGSKLDFHKEANIRFDGVKIPHLFPGEQLKFQSAEHPSAEFQQFEQSSLRHLAAGLNLSYEQLSRDYSQTNYSSARASMLETWRFILGRRHTISAHQAQFEFTLWLEEAIDKGFVVLPKSDAGFYEAKAAWTKGTWIGPGRVHIDPLKEAKADKENFSLGVTTMEQLCAERGLDYEEVLEQRAREKKYMESIGLSFRDLAGAAGVVSNVAGTSKIEPEEEPENGNGEDGDKSKGSEDE